MKMTPANPAVGNWRNKGPEMLDPPGHTGGHGNEKVADQAGLGKVN